ncbi:MAG: hypothetical protein ACTHOA_07880 [Rhodanobacter sp.]
MEWQHQSDTAENVAAILRVLLPIVIELTMRGSEQDLGSIAYPVI